MTKIWRVVFKTFTKALTLFTCSNRLAQGLKSYKLLNTSKGQACFLLGFCLSDSEVKEMLSTLVATNFIAGYMPILKLCNHSAATFDSNHSAATSDSNHSPIISHDTQIHLMHETLAVLNNLISKNSSEFLYPSPNVEYLLSNPAA